MAYKKIWFIVLPALAVLGLSACQKKGYEKIFNNPDLYSKTVHELNRVVMGNNFTPVVASRNYAYATIAGYEVVAAGDPQHYKSLKGQLNGLAEVPKPEAGATIDFSYAALLAFCQVGEAVTFPEGSLRYYTDSLHTLAVSHGMPEEVITGSENYAKSVAKAIMTWSKGDNYLKTRTAPKFAINDSSWRWVPTPPTYNEAVEPHWGEIRPMVMASATEVKVAPPLKFNMVNTASPYYREVKLIKNAGDSLTKDQIHMADFWDDNPQKLNVAGHIQLITKKFSPPGHWLSIVGIGAQKAKADYNTTVYAYAKTAIALFDAFIQSWAAKYIYNTVRPETVIDKYIEPTWRPHLQTPPFPEYTCGHCTISAAAAEALTSALGDDIAYKDTSELEFNIKSRSYPSFKAAAKETAMARFYGGIHYLNSCTVSTVYGSDVGKMVVDRVRMKK